MRYFIIFGITLILALLLIFYRPYLGEYRNTVTIEYDDHDEGYTWSYDIDNNNLELLSSEGNKWTFKPVHNGKATIIFTFSNEDNTKYTITYKFKVLGNNIYWTDGVGTGLTSFKNPY